MIVQKLHKRKNDTLEKAQVYYSVLSAINGMGLTKREVELIAFAAVYGNISRKNVKEEFCKKYSPTTIATINNMVSKLRKLSIFIKEAKVIRINPMIALDFNKDIVLQITLQHETT